MLTAGATRNTNTTTASKWELEWDPLNGEEQNFPKAHPCMETRHCHMTYRSQKPVYWWRLGMIPRIKKKVTGKKSHVTRRIFAKTTHTHTHTHTHTFNGPFPRLPR